MVASLNILIVEDNHELRETTVQVLRDEGHQAIGVSCAEDVAGHQGQVDLMVIDLNLPGEDGLSLARHVRQIQPEMGIIMVTARGLAEDKKLGYESGADIYLAKPVSFQELCAAILALARRIRALTPALAQIKLHSSRLLLQGVHDEKITISTHEVALLMALMREPGHRLESWQLIELLRKDELLDPKAALELQIVRLRKKLSQVGAPSPTIQNIRGWGYQLCVPIQLV